MTEVDVAIVGGGAAGITAGRHLCGAGVSYLVLEAGTRLGGRARTSMSDGLPLDLGCGWLHSADRNPWVEIAASAGFEIDRTPPPWGRQAGNRGFTPTEWGRRQPAAGLRRANRARRGEDQGAQRGQEGDLRRGEERRL